VSSRQPRGHGSTGSVQVSRAVRGDQRRLDVERDAPFLPYPIAMIHNGGMNRVARPEHPVTDSTSPPQHDIETREDIELLVETFYTRAFADPVLGPIFIDVAQLDLPTHMPIMCDFWENILFDARKYPGGMMFKHMQLHMLTPLRMHHFQRWLDNWVDTVEALFEGPRANLAKMHASRVAGMMAQRFEQLPGGGERVAFMPSRPGNR
jgi:hemoglobin